MKTKEEFTNFYNNLASNDLEIKNDNKKIGTTEIFILIALMISITPIIIALTIIVKSVFFKIFLPIVLIAIIIVLYVFVIIPTFKKNIKIKCFENKYKNILINYLLEDKNFNYDKNEYIPRDIFRESKLFGQFNNYSGEDLVNIEMRNEKNNYTIMFSDLNVFNEEVKYDFQTKTSNTEITPVFNGIFGVVSFEKKFNFNLSINRRIGSCEKVVLEGIDFNKKFVIYSNDQIISRVVFTPDRMERMLKIKKPKSVVAYLNQYKLFFAFFNTHLFDAEFVDKKLTISVDDFYEDVKNLNLFIEEISNLTQLKDY